GRRACVGRESKKGQAQGALLAAGVARAAGELDWAEELLAAAEPLCTGVLRAVWQNEHAALLWHRGRCPEALKAWQALPDSPTILFNRGMALLFLGKTVEARTTLTSAAAVLPESSGWYALARLYLAIAEL